jgi:ABC-type transport system involved in multi-copper enzyme maturation permease subunit
MEHVVDLLVAEWLLLRNIKLARLVFLTLAILPSGVILLGVIISQGQPWIPFPDVVSLIEAAMVSVNALSVGLVLVISIGYEFTWGTVRTAVVRGISRQAWLGAKVLAVVLVDGLVLIFSTLLGIGALLVVYWTQGQGMVSFPWRTVVSVQLGGMLAALVAASGVALGTVATRSAAGGLVLGLMGYAVDMALTATNMNISASDLKTVTTSAYTTYLVTWNAISLALQEYHPLPAQGRRIILLALYAAVGLSLARWVFRRQDLTRGV